MWCIDRYLMLSFLAATLLVLHSQANELDGGESNAEDAVMALWKSGATINEQDEGTSVHLRTPLTAETVELLVHLEGMSNLKFLRLDKTRIRGEGLRHIAGATKLRVLDLGGTQASDETLQHIVGCTDLYHLDLNGCGISDDGCSFSKGRPKWNT